MTLSRVSIQNPTMFGKNSKTLNAYLKDRGDVAHWTRLSAGCTEHQSTVPCCCHCYVTSAYQPMPPCTPQTFPQAIVPFPGSYFMRMLISCRTLSRVWIRWESLNRIIWGMCERLEDGKTRPKRESKGAEPPVPLRSVLIPSYDRWGHWGLVGLLMCPTVHS